jgi:predicted SAM-dependent methyltransferase
MMKTCIFFRKLLFVPAKKIIPKRYHPFIIRYVRHIISPIYRGEKFICPVCEGHFRKLLTAGVKPRPNAQCPKCGSFERHRLLWLYLKERTNFFTANLTVLEIAPLDYLQHKFRAMPNLDYVSVDLQSPVAMAKMDITDMQFQANHFDCIICYHVLEHITDDQKAMREIFRVLKPDGWAICQVPILNEKTFEDPSITTPADRRKFFGDPDHVRIYGLDYRNRLERIGFTVKVDDYVKQLSDDAIKKYSLIKGEDIYLCKKHRTKGENRFENVEVGSGLHEPED